MKTYFFTYLIALLAVTNSVGNIAIFLALTHTRTPKQKRNIGFTATFSVLIILLLSTWFGDYILKLFGISLPAFELAGGLVVIFIGLSMLKAQTSQTSQTDKEFEIAKTKDSIAVVPLSIPIIAGPGSITTAIIASHRFPDIGDKLLLSSANLIVAIVIALMLFFATFIEKIIGQSGIKILTRIMGLILIAIAFEMIIHGCQTAFPKWK